jgi:hypothetical protein
MCLTNLKGLAQVVRALVLVAFPSSLRFESPLVQTILWDQPISEAGVLSNPCGGGHFTRVQGLLDKGGYMKWPYLEGVPCYQK